MKLRKVKSGATLIELALGIALTSILVIAASSILIATYETNFSINKYNISKTYVNAFKNKLIYTIDANNGSFKSVNTDSTKNECFSIYSTGSNYDTYYYQGNYFYKNDTVNTANIVYDSTYACTLKINGDNDLYNFTISYEKIELSFYKTIYFRS